MGFVCEWTRVLFVLHTVQARNCLYAANTQLRIEICQLFTCKINDAGIL